jgi:hypothetical protein
MEIIAGPRNLQQKPIFLQMVPTVCEFKGYVASYVSKLPTERSIKVRGVNISALAGTSAIGDI